MNSVLWQSVTYRIWGLSPITNRKAAISLAFYLHCKAIAALFFISYVVLFENIAGYGGDKSGLPVCHCFLSTCNKCICFNVQIPRVNTISAFAMPSHSSYNVKTVEKAGANS